MKTEEIITQVKAEINRSGLSQSAVAKQAGINSGALSAYLMGKYKGKNENIENALIFWLQSLNSKAQYAIIAPDFVLTETANRVFKALDMARSLPTMTTLYGASGVGKTRAASEYVKQHGNCWLVTASPSRATLSAILFDIAEEVGINDAPRQKAKLSRLLEKKLKGSNGLLIIDESDHLSYDALEELRILQESTQIGISLIGNHRVYTRLSGGNNQAHEFARLWSRIGKHFGFKGSLKADVLAIAKAWGLDMNNEKLMALVLSIGQKAGGLRSLTQHLRLASLAAGALNCPIDYELLSQAQAQMKS